MPKQTIVDQEITAISIRIPLPLKAIIEQRAQRNHRSINQEAVWLLHASLGQPPLADRKISFSSKAGTAVIKLRMPINLKRQIERLARKSLRSLNQQILWLFEGGLEQLRSEEQPPSS